MSDNARYWIWLQSSLGYAKAFKPLIDEFGDIKSFYDSDVLDYKMSPNLTFANVDKLISTDISVSDGIIDTCNKNGWKIIDYDDELYPKKLRQISNPPAVLYADGEMPDVDSVLSIGVVGTRKASEYSSAVAKIMSAGCADGGAVIVSGGALGIDSQAHLGALSVGGKTIAVLGNGLGDDYLKANKQLRENIRQNGAVVTEYQPFCRASKSTFPMRNRIISGLSDGVLIVEAGIKSGSLITASYAAEQNRDVFVIPASILSSNFAGTNKLIDDGAIVATKPLSIVASYAGRYDTLDPDNIRDIDWYLKNKNKNSANAQKYTVPDFNAGMYEREAKSEREIAAGNLEGDLQTVYNCLSDCFENLNYIIEKSQLSNSRVLSALTQLELKGLAVSASGRRYKKS